jgi:hypothetical protein
MKNENQFLESLSSSHISYRELENSFLPEQNSDNPCGYRALWRAVITQALMDAGSNSKKIEFRKEKARAISWLNGDSEDFSDVCALAGLDAGYVKKKAKEAIKNGCKWREEVNPFFKRNNIERKNRAEMSIPEKSQVRRQIQN